MNKNKLNELVARIEAKLDKMPDNTKKTKEKEDILLTKGILEFILMLAQNELSKNSENGLVATLEEVYNLTHDE